MSERRKNKHLTLQERYVIERMLRKKYTKKQIADAIGCCLATVYNEIKRGLYLHTIDYRDVKRYAPDLAHRKYLDMLSKKGTSCKILDDEIFRKDLRTLIVDKKYSPAAALMKMSNGDRHYKIEIKSVNTIYLAIRKKYIDGVSLQDLPDRGFHKRKRKQKTVVAKKAVCGTSIEKRPSAIKLREEFGHWEMDTVKGKQTNKKCLLVLTERVSRLEIIEPMKSCTTAEVVKALNRLEKIYRSSFFDVFKSITVDNGSEFADYKGMEKALYRVGTRTKIYYCHPYAPHERGSNEVQNKLIRRFYPKSSDFDSILNKKQIKRIEAWINTYPRKLFNGNSAAAVYRSLFSFT